MILLGKQLSELGNKIANVSFLATKTALTAVENKITDVSSLDKKNKKKKTLAKILLKLKRNLLIIIMANILLVQSLIPWLLMFLIQD